MKVVIIVKLKRSIIITYIICIIVSKLSYQKESSLVVMLVIDKNLNINFYYIIFFLGQVIKKMIQSLCLILKK